MKKFIALLLAAFMVLSLAACSGQDENTGDENQEQEQEQTPDDSSNGDGSEVQEPDQNGDEQVPDEGGTDPDAGAGQDGQAASPLSSTMASILDGVADLPMVGDVPLDASNFEFYAFIPYVDGYVGLASDAMINAIAHSVVLVQVPDGTDAQSVADSIEENANPAKWVCVTAEKTAVAVNGNLILLVMSAEATCDAIVENFQAL